MSGLSSDPLTYLATALVPLFPFEEAIKGIKRLSGVQISQMQANVEASDLHSGWQPRHFIQLLPNLMFFLTDPASFVHTHSILLLKNHGGSHVVFSCLLGF